MLRCCLVVVQWWCSGLPPFAFPQGRGGGRRGRPEDRSCPSGYSRTQLTQHPQRTQRRGLNCFNYDLPCGG
ncbi:hypothetical protein BZA05DRAFT_391394 [Tricharina praecox]|uniref:uncharacterized protein n=1 Tax=Tricharina praecox TaxID=43433 RepID=UPI00221EB325|nr:uncharacterized protein BZA05DRAFT_391394 [Tricharina praecox]KAI5855366.1 hypothetical protein BZA05DRAFT_391394 [Tricharina praecox]